MAKKLKKNKLIKNSALAKVLREQPMHNFAMEAIVKYGTYVIENRALPDYRDGLKPVQRRILWAMKESGFKNNGPMVKSARVTGEVMGKYHPHGDSYGSLVNMYHQSTPMIDIEGNWGDMSETPAAPRYTECKLSKYSEKILLDNSYLDIIEKMPTYSGEFLEPLVLPALLPHLLLNGVAGIAVGVIVGMPPFEAKGVTNLIRKGLKDSVTVKDCVKHLTVKYPFPYNSEVLSSDEDLKTFIETGSGKLSLGVGYETHNNQMIITRFPPNFYMPKAIEKLMAIDEVASASDHTGRHTETYKLVVELKQGTQVNGRAKIFKDCAARLNENFNMRINLIERIDEEKVKFKYSNMPDFVNMWIKWRIEIEVKRHLYDAEQLTKSIANLELQVLACINLDKIVPIIKSNLPNVDERLQKALDITLEQAKYILSLTLRRLTGLSLKELKDKIAAEKLLRKASLHHAKNPADKILADLDGLVKGIF